MINPSEISDILKQQLVEDIAKRQAAFEEEGTVLEVGDGVAHAYGLHNVEANELVQFENGVTGVAMNLEESDVGIILLDEVDSVTENMKVRRTGERSFNIVLVQGLNRQIRRMCEALGANVTHLRRVRIMNLRLGKLQPGQWRELTEREKAELLESLS